MTPETRYEIIEVNELRKLQESDEVWSEMLKWVLAGSAPRMIDLIDSAGSVVSETNIQSYVICNS